MLFRPNLTKANKSLILDIHGKLSFLKCRTYLVKPFLSLPIIFKMAQINPKRGEHVEKDTVHNVEKYHKS